MLPDAVALVALAAAFVAVGDDADLQIQAPQEKMVRDADSSIHS